MVDVSNDRPVAAINQENNKNMKTDGTTLFRPIGNNPFAETNPDFPFSSRSAEDVSRDFPWIENPQPSKFAMDKVSLDKVSLDKVRESRLFVFN